MTPIEPVVLSFTAAFLLGLGFGAGPCNLACLPYLGPVFLARGESGASPWRTVLPFSLGRFAGYSLLGAAAGGTGLLVQDWVAGPWARWLLGAATVAVGLSLLARRRRSNCALAAAAVSNEVRFEPRRPRGAAVTGGLFTMGLGMAFNPCAPLTTVVLASATTASVPAGLHLGGGFGLGAVLVPALVFGWGVSRFGDQVREHLQAHRPALEAASAALLVALRAATAVGWVSA